MRRTFDEYLKLAIDSGWEEAMASNELINQALHPGYQSTFLYYTPVQPDSLEKQAPMLRVEPLHRGSYMEELLYLPLNYTIVLAFLFRMSLIILFHRV